MKVNGKKWWLLFTLPLLLLCSEAQAASQLMVAPTRIVFEGQSRTAQVTVINSGDATGTYRIKLVNKRMTEDGQFEDVETANPDELFADNMIRFSPRQVVLEAGKSQVVRLSLRKPAKLQNGEYRSHLLFQAIPENAGTDIRSAIKKEGISVQLTAIVSVSIPVIVRHGDTTTTVAFTAIKYEPPANKESSHNLLLELERTGNQSVYGDFLTEFVDAKGNSTIISQVNGVAIYTPNTKRKIKVPLTTPPGVELKTGVINVFYRSPQNQGGAVMAQTRLKLQ
ncbi:fimbrial biogenesis chaperone [Kaarinaea lacus]